MSDRGNNTEQLAEALKGHDRAIWNGHAQGWCCSKCGTRSDNGSDLTLHTAQALLASDWLRDHDAVVADRARREALQEAAELVDDANEQGLGLGAAYRSILREATTPQPQEEQQP